MSQGAMLRAIMAASIGMVPAPQQGSRRGVFQCRHDIYISAAAIFSLMGASPVCVLYPLLWSHLPVVFIYTLSVSWFNITYIPIVGISPSMSRTASGSPVSLFIIALCITDWTDLSADSVDCLLCILTTIHVCIAMYFVQSTFEMSSKSVSKSRTFLCESSG